MAAKFEFQKKGTEASLITEAGKGLPMWAKVRVKEFAAFIFVYLLLIELNLGH